MFGGIHVTYIFFLHRNKISKTDAIADWQQATNINTSKPAELNPRTKEHNLTDMLEYQSQFIHCDIYTNMI